MFVVAEREAFRGAVGQVVSFVHDQHRIVHVPSRHGLKGGPVARREDVVVVADHHVRVREHCLGDIPGRHAGDTADLANPTEVGGFLKEMLRVDLRVGPVTPDLLRVVGDAVDLVFGARAE